MKKIFSGFKDEQDGAIAIEACISLTLFLIVMIALYSVIQVFTVQSMISHAMQEACQSMALENYNQSMFKTGTLQQIPSKVFDWISGGHRENFSTSADFSWKGMFSSLQSTTEMEQTETSNAKTICCISERWDGRRRWAVEKLWRGGRSGWNFLCWHRKIWHRHDHTGFLQGSFALLHRDVPLRRI